MSAGKKESRKEGFQRGLGAQGCLSVEGTTELDHE